MMIEEIVYGESKNVEFKVSLPEKSDKYTKTIVAFANTQGGKLIIGVDDKTRKVVGVDKDEAFEMMDSISNAVSDSCIPQIVPDIELQTADGKTIIVVTVAPGPNRPYYLKSKGKAGGTFIRVAGTTRPAYPEKIKELEMEGARISWDELTLRAQGDTRPKCHLLEVGGVNVNRRTSSTPHSVALPITKIWHLGSEGVLRLRFAILQGAGTKRTGRTLSDSNVAESQI